MNAFANVLLHSSSAAARVGPRIGNPSAREVIDDAPAQREFGPDDGQADAIRARQGGRRVRVGRIDGFEACNVGACRGCPGRR